MAAPTFTPKTTYIIYIAGSAEAVWAALTDGAASQKYFFGRRVESTWEPGATVNYWQEDGTLDVTGTIQEIEAPRRVSFTWRVEWIEEMRKLPECLVTYQLDDLGEVVRLTMTEAHQWEAPVELLKGGRAGWPAILSGLKTLVETGAALPMFDMRG